MDAPPRLVLASASPRRRRLLAWLGVPYEVTSVDVDEDLTGPLAADPSLLAGDIALSKARAAASADLGGDVILACDTIVVCDGDILGKPVDLDDAVRMLRVLSGRTHEVVTGVAITETDLRDERTFSVTTPVHMRALSEADIDAWVAEGELLGCAGAYNIERHLAHVDADECFQNVAGLPLCHVFASLSPPAGRLPGLRAPVERCDAARCTRCLLGPRIVAR